MTTLIAVYTNDGCVGRCDAKCYNATHPDCDCICGGRNHGAGLDQAVENTTELAERWLDDYHQAKGLDPTETRSTISPQAQPTLFNLSDYSKLQQIA